MRRSARIASYEADYNSRELEFLSRSLDSVDARRFLADTVGLTDVHAFLSKAWVVGILRQVQQTVWTVRAMRRRFAGRTTPRALGTPATSEERRDRKIVFDVTGARSGTVGGGIRRVCWSLMHEFRAAEDCAFVETIEGSMRELERDGTAGAGFSLRRDDDYIVLDSFWAPRDVYSNNLIRAKEVGARTSLVVYDIIQLIYPGLLAHRHSREVREALAAMLPLTDTIITISKSSMREIRIALRAARIECPPIHWFHLGAEADTFGGDHVGSRRRPRFISIGTLEPKKGYGLSLRAFEMVWASGRDCEFAIFGKRGWLCEHLVEQIVQHEEFGRRLFWHESATDAEIREAASRSTALIQSSVAEGFGLPLIEAHGMGLPVVASDLAVFKEVVSGPVRYFKTASAESLARSISFVLSNPFVDVRPTRPRSWSEAARDLRTVIDRASGRIATGRPDEPGHVATASGA